MIKTHVESVEVYDVTCERCNYQWQALGKVPVRCSRCKSPYFNQPRQKQSQKRIKRTVTFLPKEDKQ
jgi:predicted Zn-ribbon and HTH transcriptional regulator